MEASAVYARWKCGVQNKKQAWSILIWKQIFARLNIILDQTSTLQYVASFLSLYWIVNLFAFSNQNVILFTYQILQYFRLDLLITIFITLTYVIQVRLSIFSVGTRKQYHMWNSYLTMSLHLHQQIAHYAYGMSRIIVRYALSEIIFFIWHSCLLSFCSIGNWGAIFV